MAGTARRAVRAAFSGANLSLRFDPLPASFRPLNAGGDIAARCPYQPPPDTFNHAHGTARDLRNSALLATMR